MVIFATNPHIVILLTWHTALHSKVYLLLYVHMSLKNALSLITWRGLQATTPVKHVVQVACQCEPQYVA